jgi:23S rRNA (adenine2503-C2)-methyltransferase
MAARRTHTTRTTPGSASARASRGSGPGPDAETVHGRLELLAFTPEELRVVLGELLNEQSEPSYRADQLRHWVFERGVGFFEEMTTLPQRLLGQLAERFSLTPLAVAHEARSRDGTVKHLWNLEDGEAVESVLIPSGDRLTLCLSSQAGCALACRFCATGYLGLQRQLRPAEIVAQYRESERVAQTTMGRSISNIVYMGMGEPLANLDAVLTSLSVFHRSFGFGARRITVSTVGLIPGIQALARRSEPFELAVSLHAPMHELRLELMPVERRYPLDDLFRALREYQEAKRRRISFEYTMIRNVNDSAELADVLADRAHGLTCFVNLIPFNPIPDRPEWRASSRTRMDAFRRALGARGIEAAIREPRGLDIAAACGQLRLERIGRA